MPSSSICPPLALPSFPIQTEAAGPSGLVWLLAVCFFFFFHQLKIFLFSNSLWSSCVTLPLHGALVSGRFLVVFFLCVETARLNATAANPQGALYRTCACASVSVRRPSLGLFACALVNCQRSVYNVDRWPGSCGS